MRKLHAFGAQSLRRAKQDAVRDNGAGIKGPLKVHRQVESLSVAVIDQMLIL
jgi:hypothetical protein